MSLSANSWCVYIYIYKPQIFVDFRVRNIAKDPRREKSDGIGNDPGFVFWVYAPWNWNQPIDRSAFKSTIPNWFHSTDTVVRLHGLAFGCQTEKHRQSCIKPRSMRKEEERRGKKRDFSALRGLENEPERVRVFGTWHTLHKCSWLKRYWITRRWFPRGYWGEQIISYVN